MTSNAMTDALQNPHPKVLFASVEDDTISALTDLAAIFKLKLQQTPSPRPKLRRPRSSHNQAFTHHQTKS
jgi:hypothetical protein